MMQVLDIEVLTLSMVDTSYGERSPVYSYTTAAY